VLVGEGGGGGGGGVMLHCSEQGCSGSVEFGFRFFYKT